jgi:beta-glucosidase
VDGMLARGLQPWCTLYHWDLPQYLQDQGGWNNRATIDAYLRYVDVVTRHLGGRVKHWITHNEPWCTAMHGNWDGMHAPGNKSLPLALQVCHNVLVSHGRAVPLIRANVPGAQVGIALSLHPVKAASDSAGYRRRVAPRRAAQPLVPRRAVWPRLSGEALALVGKDAPKVEAGDMEAIAAPCDFLGVNYYFPKWWWMRRTSIRCARASCIRRTASVRTSAGKCRRKAGRAAGARGARLSDRRPVRHRKRLVLRRPPRAPTAR